MNAIQRLDAADQLVSLIATALTLHHPQSMRMARIGLGDLIGLHDDQLTLLTTRLEVWISEQRAAIAGPVEAVS